MLEYVLAILNIIFALFLIGLFSYKTYIDYSVAKELKKNLKKKIDSDEW